MQHLDPKNMPWDLLKCCHIYRRTPRVTFPTPTCGKVLLHAKYQVSGLRERIGISICVFKIGCTANPAQRWQAYLAKNYAEMWIIYMGEDLGLIHMLEAALISTFQSCPGCRNAPNTGGEGALNRKCPAKPPYFVYVVGAPADQPKRIG